MGLFSKLRSSGASTTNSNTALARSVITMPVLAALADGKLEDSEIREIGQMCCQNVIFLRIGVEKTLDLIREVLLDVNARGMELVFAEAIANLSPALRETALCFAIRVTVADGHMDTEERKMLVAMGERMGMAEDRFFQIIEVLMMLHRSEAA